MKPPTKKMKRWRCPKCGREQHAIGSSVQHLCTMNKGKMTSWEMVEDD